MSDYINFPNHTNDVLKNMINSMCQPQKAIYDALVPANAIQDLINQMTQPYQEISKHICPTFSLPLTELSHNISKEMIDTLKISFDASVISNELTESIRRICIAPELVSVLNGHTYNFPEDLGGLPTDDDFVTVDETAVKTYELSDSIAIPIDNNRIKISTSNFIALVSLIIQFVLSIISMIPSAPTESETKQIQAEETQILLLESQNQILCELFHNIDLSSSSQAEVLQSLKENVEAQNTAISDLEESLDSIQQSLDSMSESENTETEN